jgi:hypothetical protein
MSWSMFCFRDRWAHAHDIQQDAFMALARVADAVLAGDDTNPQVHTGGTG